MNDDEEVSLMTGPGFQQCHAVPVASYGFVTGVSKDGQDMMWAEYQSQLPFRSSVYAVVTILILASFLLAALLAYRRGER